MAQQEHDISKEFNYSDKYYDDQNEYRHVTLPRDFGTRVYKHFGGNLLAENDWRKIGIEMSRGWVHVSTTSNIITNNRIVWILSIRTSYFTLL